jgi:DNA-binding response OmpR family regulator
MPCYIRLGTITVFLDGGVIDNNGQKEEFTAPEHKLFLLLLDNAVTSPHGYLPARYLARSIFSLRYYEMDDPDHAVEQHISNMRRKLGEERRKPCYLVGCRNKGYKLCVPKGCCAVTVQVLRKLLDMLNKR